MTGPLVVRSVLVAETGVTDLVPATRIIADDVAPQGMALPLVLLKHVSGVDRKPLTLGSTVFSRRRVQCEIHASNEADRRAIKKAIRAAGLNNPFPTYSGLLNVTLHTEGEGPDFYVEATSVRIGEQDFIVTYSETV